MVKKVAYTNIYMDGHKLVVENVYEDDIRIWGPQAGMVALFFLTLAVSGILFFWDGVSIERFNRLEFAALAFLLSAEMLYASLTERTPRMLFIPVCLIGITWSVLSLLLNWLPFDLVGYVFFYTGLVTIMYTTLLLKEIFR
jgi:hypothetical protein